MPMRTCRRVIVLLGIILLMASSRLSAFAGSSNSLLDISSDGKLLACSNRDSGTVTIVDPTTFTKLREIPVGHKPEGVTFLGETHQLAVAIYADDVVVFVDADKGEVIGRCEVDDEPYSVVATRDGSRVWVTLEYPGQLIEIDTSSRKILRTFAAGSFPRGLALANDQKTAFVTEYYTATVRLIDLASGKELAAVPASSTDNLARQITVHPTRPKAYVPHQRSKTSAAHGEGSIFPYISVIDLPTAAGAPSEEIKRKRIPRTRSSAIS